jgi:hypothetical protein
LHISSGDAFFFNPLAAASTFFFKKKVFHFALFRIIMDRFLTRPIPTSIASPIPSCSFSCQEPSASAGRAADRKRKAAVAQFVAATATSDDQDAETDRIKVCAPA